MWMISRDIIKGKEKKTNPLFSCCWNLGCLHSFYYNVAVSNYSSVISLCKYIWRKLLKMQLLRPLCTECFWNCPVAGLADSQLLPPCCTLPCHNMTTVFIFANLMEEMVLRIASMISSQSVTFDIEHFLHGLTSNLHFLWTIFMIFRMEYFSVRLRSWFWVVGFWLFVLAVLGLPCHRAAL